MSQNNALYLKAKHGALEVISVPVPKPGAGEVLINVQAAALNPADWKIKERFGDLFQSYPIVLGGDIAGIVHEVGEGVTDLKKGDRVLALTLYGTITGGGYQQYATELASLTAKIPDDVSFDAASTIPLGLTTAALGLFYQGSEPGSGSIGLFPPWEDGGRGKYAGEPIFIVGGASSVGQFAIQLAKLAGFDPIITTASLKNAETLKKQGATHVLDRNLPEDALVAEVQKITTKPIKVAFDPISSHQTQNVSYKILGSGGALVVDEPEDVDEVVADKRLVRVLANANLPATRELGVSLFSKIFALLEEGLIKPNPVEVLPNGLNGVADGLKKLEKGVSNVKLVARPQEMV